jgi:hypothetical protein
VPAKTEEPLDVAQTTGAGQTGLRGAGARAGEDAEHRQTQLTREVVSLVEAALKSPPRMQRHRHDVVGVFEKACPRGAHASRQGRGEIPAALVLEGVNEMTEHALMEAGAASQSEGGRRLEASGTAPLGARNDVAAVVTEGRREASN